MASSYLSTILTTTKSRVNSLRAAYLPDETDGDTEDDSHITRVLRAYYTEKGRPFPPWLPPDPNRKFEQPANVMLGAGGRGQQVGAGYGRGGGMGRGGLSDLWGPGGGQQQPPQQESFSLRRGGRGTASPAPPPGGRPGFGLGGIVDSYGSGSANSERPAPGRGTSYNSLPERLESPPPTASSTGSAQDRLKAKLWGRGASPAPAADNAASAGSLGVGVGAVGGRSSPFSGGGLPSRPGKSTFDDAAASYGRASGNRYEGGRDDGGYGGGGRETKPYMGATTPWSTGGDEYGGGGGGGGAYGDDGGYGGGGGRKKPPAGGRMGLPSGPRMMGRG